MNIMRSNFRNMQVTQMFFFLMSDHCQNYWIYYHFSKGALA